MGEKLDAPLPEFMVVDGGWQFVWDAVDPTTGASVAGVVVTNKSVQAADASTAPVPEVDSPLLAHDPSGNVPPPTHPGTNP